MDHADHVRLLQPAIPIPRPDAKWADMGAGRGAFTLALADLLGPGASVFAVDHYEHALRENAKHLTWSFPRTKWGILEADFTTSDIDVLPPLDGLVAANSLHFVPRPRQVAVIAALAARLKPGGAFVVVEYDADSGNQWVPYPFSARAWPALAQGAGLVSAREIGRVPSRFLGAIYSAAAHRPAD